MTTIEVVSEGLKELMDDPELGRFSLYTGQFIAKSYEIGKKGVVQFLKDNSIGHDAPKDVLYGAICIELIGAGVIKSSGDANYTATEAEIAMILMSLIEAGKSLARTVCMVALHAFCQGIDGNSLSWYNSLMEVEGNFISKCRLVDLLKLIQASGTIPQIMECMAVDIATTENNIFKYRFTRLSAPGLIRTALKALTYEVIYDFFDPDVYKMFDESGILAQIASGPLNIYCKGKIDPIRHKNIPPNVKLSDLKP